MTGRPTLYTPELFEGICERMAKGEPLAVICREDGMPHPSTVRDWANGDEALSRRFGRAREDGEDAIAADCLKIADDGTNDTTIVDGMSLLNSEHIQRSKLRVETRLKLLAKFNPKRWGDKVEVDNKHSGNVGMTILTAVPEPSPAETEDTP